MVKQSETKAIIEPDWLYKKYSRDPSPSARANELAWILGKLKKEAKFSEFEPLLRDLINQVREWGSTEARKRERVIKSLKSYAAEVSEIASEARLTKDETREICEQLAQENLVRRDYRTHTNECGLHKVVLYFWRENESHYK